MSAHQDENDAPEWESVTVQTIMATTRLDACPQCRALVRASDRQTHEEWHASVIPPGVKP